ncbi:SLC13 family permease [Pararhodospirillum oryzae]|uniref:Sodium:sulfate symporter n=1 Tax=Pararhodospirillum oryzae TaxID=478448 RepID=A0A512H6X2_9PROT|nr:SLC13 family permease [Pararhodospirillum oryzae]GEO81192.1 sodium:sulfate symporter [Pararhodospirillum oryzae]
MTPDLVLVLALLAVAVGLFARGRPSMDVVALMVMACLPFTGTVTATEALAGFADPNVILIAALFILGEGLVRTGVAKTLGGWITVLSGGREGRLIAALMAAASGLGAFMSSTGVVAIFIPIVLRVARAMKIPASRLMMPLSMAALISGMMTLVATAPNLVVNAELARRGYEGFGFFAFTPFGLPVLALAIGYMLLARRFLGGAVPAPGVGRTRRPGLADWIKSYDLARREARLRVLPASDLAGRRLDELALRATEGVNILAIERMGRFGPHFLRPRRETELAAGDVLLVDVVDPQGDLEAVAARHQLVALPLSGAYFLDRAQELGMAEALVPPDSSLVERTPAEVGFRSTRDVSVIAVRRGTGRVEGPAASIALKAGDQLLLIGPWSAIRRLAGERHDLVVLDLPEEADDYAPARERAPYAVLVLLAMVAVMASGLLPNAQAALIGCLLLGAFGCVNAASAYRSINWPTLVLIVGMLPFALALERTGGVDLAAQALIQALGETHPQAMLAVLFAVTAGLGLFISNTATAVLMAPVAVTLAQELGVSPHPFAMTVALAASTAFMTPVSSPVNTLVVGPGGYRFMDFVRIGVPFSLLTMAVCVGLVPLVLPF